MLSLGPLVETKMQCVSLRRDILVRFARTVSSENHCRVVTSRVSVGQGVSFLRVSGFQSGLANTA